MKRCGSIRLLLFVHGYYLVVFGNYALIMLSAGFLAFIAAVYTLEFVLFAICIASIFAYNKIFRGIGGDETKLRIERYLNK